MTRPAVLAAVLLMAWGPAWAMERNRPFQAGAHVPFEPTTPVGVETEFPRSPLADVFVNGDVRFAHEAEARARCPTDRVVWVTIGSNVFHTAKPHADANRIFGAFMCRTDALSEGDRPSRRN